MKIIAKTPRVATAMVMVMASPVILRPIVDPTIAGLVWSIATIAIVVRVSQIHIGVHRDFVRVQNFFRTTDVPIWEAEVEQGEPEPELGFIELREGEEDTAGRLLYIKRPWHGDRVHVGASPRFGPEAVRIRSELTTEIKRARAA